MTLATRLSESRLRSNSVRMFLHHPEEFGATAADVRSHLVTLEQERALALSTGLAEVSSYMGDLDAEIEETLLFYVGFAVTEIATLRAEMSGPLTG